MQSTPSNHNAKMPPSMLSHRSIRSRSQSRKNKLCLSAENGCMQINRAITLQCTKESIHLVASAVRLGMWHIVVDVCCQQPRTLCGSFNNKFLRRGHFKQLQPRPPCLCWWQIGTNNYIILVTAYCFIQVANRQICVIIIIHVSLN